MSKVISSDPTAFPLSWPAGKLRTAAHRRKRSHFKVSFAQARDELLTELERMQASKIVLSTNIQLRRDGLPYANFREPNDPGVALYFVAFKKSYAFACDQWDLTRDNLRAIGCHISALRGIERWGVSSVEEVFSPFALPESIPWWSVLGVQQDANFEQVRAAYRRLSQKHHPDAGGDRPAWDRIVHAYETAKSKDLG
jgi:DnaJ-domain-containing protein 1